MRNFFNPAKRRVRRERGDGVYLHPVAGGKGWSPSVAMPEARNARNAAGNRFPGKGETLAEFNRRRAMAKTDDDNAHGWCMAE